MRKVIQWLILKDLNNLQIDPEAVSDVNAIPREKSQHIGEMWLGGAFFTPATSLSSINLSSDTNSESLRFAMSMISPQLTPNVSSGHTEEI